ncbi:YcjF family protein [Pseudoruegeria sp. SK021]|uniref:YcjF family protein n=1 Tax=Pseudoruegeria sp. SK021 TaxID=1933035 RepID=UPI000A222B2F|nr:TIGR01620 family protein [Pseudoruegeria sp. SK021]OSP55643.1 hypothetical protein BV911_05880 [Pseudoruegeria sp. SK021]
MNDAKTGPVRIDLDLDAPTDDMSPSSAPPVPEADQQPTDAAAMQRLATMAARPSSRLARWFWGLLISVIGFFISLAAWNAIVGLLTSNAILGAVATVLLGAFVVVCAAIALREVSAFARLSRLDRIQMAAATALADHDLAHARRIATSLTTFYATRPELRWACDAMPARLAETFDADAALGLAEMNLIAPLDRLAIQEVEAAARRVATVTALVPLALADVVAAMTSNLAMIRRIAEVYGGRSGTLGTWRLLRAVLTHLVATGAVAIGDDLIGSVAGGSVLSKLSRRFGEGVVNGALTARVGVAAIEVCRPLPFRARPRPSVTGIVKRALTGLFGDRV